MDLTFLKSKSVEWLQGGPEGDVAVSSRVRLARNIDGFPFVPRATERQRARIEELLRNVILSLDVEPPLEYVRVDKLEPLLRELLLERRLISGAHAGADWVRSLALDRSGQVSIMVNEEDHLRLQFVRGGFRLEEAYEKADQFDDALSQRVPLAFSDKYGYLTACPTNVGTGLRASIVLHLPGIAMAQEMDKVVEIARAGKLTLRGVYGEGTHGAGDFYQISNHVTLGPSEDEILEAVAGAGRQLVELERTSRQGLYQAHPEEFRSRVETALRLLRSAAAISAQETLSFLSQVKMGVEMGLLPEGLREALNELLLLTLPAHLQTMEGRVLDSAVRNELRASYVKSRLSTG